MADLLGTEPRRPVPRRRRATAVLAVTAVGVAVLLASRADPDRPPGPAARTPVAPVEPAPTPRTSAPAVVAVAVGTGSAYALVAQCGSELVQACRYRLHRRPPAGGWRELPLRAENRSTGGVDPGLYAPGGDAVLLVLRGRAGRAYPLDGGGRSAPRELLPGPPVGRVPADGAADPGLCADCAERVTALEPGTGLLRPLAAQPFGGAPVRSYDQRGDVLWATGAGPAGLRTAVSTDRGARWREVPGPAGTADRRIVAAPDGGGWLLGYRLGADVGDRLSEVWRVDGPGGSWRRLDPTGPRTVRSAVAAGPALVATDESGRVWRMPPAGGFARTRVPAPESLDRVVAGPGGALAGLPFDGGDRVLLSDDGGATWRVERVLG